MSIILITKPDCKLCEKVKERIDYKIYKEIDYYSLEGWRRENGDFCSDRTREKHIITGFQIAGYKVELSELGLLDDDLKFPILVIEGENSNNVFLMGEDAVTVAKFFRKKPLEEPEQKQEIVCDDDSCKMVK